MGKKELLEARQGFGVDEADVLSLRSGGSDIRRIIAVSPPMSKERLLELRRMAGGMNRAIQLICDGARVFPEETA